MIGPALVAAGLLLAGFDLGDEVMDWWWLSLLLVVVGLWAWVLTSMATPAQDARFSAVDVDVDRHHAPAGGVVVPGGASTSGGVRAPGGFSSDEEAGL